MGDDFHMPDQVVGVNQGMLRHFNLPALLIPLGDVCDLLIVGVLEVVPMVDDHQARQIGSLGRSVCLRLPTAFRVADLDPAVDDKLFSGLRIVFLVGLLVLAVFLQEVLGFQTQLECLKDLGKVPAAQVPVVEIQSDFLPLTQLPGGQSEPDVRCGISSTVVLAHPLHHVRQPVLHLAAVEKHPIMRQFAQAEDQRLLQGADGFDSVQQWVCLNVNQAPQLAFQSADFLGGILPRLAGLNQGEAVCLRQKLVSDLHKGLLGPPGDVEQVLFLQLKAAEQLEWDLQLHGCPGCWEKVLIHAAVGLIPCRDAL